MPPKHPCETWSTAGVVAAKLSGCQLLDSDFAVMQRDGCLLPEIIRQDGVEDFLSIENRVNASLRRMVPGQREKAAGHEDCRQPEWNVRVRGIGLLLFGLRVLSFNKLSKEAHANNRRAPKRIESYRLYLENEFYPEYGRNFEDKVPDTIRLLPDQPDLGHAAFPELNRPELRKLLCKHYSYWIFYRRKKTRCETLSVRHTLMNITLPRQL